MDNVKKTINKAKESKAFNKLLTCSDYSKNYTKSAFQIRDNQLVKKCQLFGGPFKFVKTRP